MTRTPLQEPAPVGPRTPVDAGPGPGGPAAPRLADGVELLGEFRGSGYREPRYLVRRPDGQVIALPRALHLLASGLDGRRDPAGLAAHLQAGGVPMDAPTVARLVETRLAPAGIAAAGPGGVTVAGPRPDPLLMLRFRLPVVQERAVWRIAGVAAPLFHPVAVAVALAAFVAVDVAVVLTAGLAGVTGAALGVVQAPATALLVLLALLLAGALHECGHVGACRYGGARPGPMGVGIYLVWPAYYSTVTDSYRLSRAGRLRVDLGGVHVNAILMALLGAAWLATGAPWLLVAALVLHAETARQFLPSIRLDGYYILSDLVGLPDLFMFLRPVLSSLRPGRPPHPRVAELAPRARRIIVAWTLLVIPFLASFVVLFVVLAPQVLPAVADRLAGHLTAVGAAVRDGDPTLGTLNVLQALLVLLPVLGGALLVGLAARRIGTWVRAEPRARRHGGVIGSLATAAVPVLLLALLAAAGLDQRVARGPEAAVAAGTAAPDSPLHHLLAALGVLLGSPGGLLDTARAGSLACGVATALLMWPVARRLRLPGPAAAVVVALAGVPALVAPAFGVVDAGAPAALLLGTAAALAGRGPGARAAALVAAGTAVVLTPVAAAGLLAFAAHAVASGQLARTWRRVPARVAAAVLATGAAAAAAASVGAGEGSLAPGVVLAGVLAGAAAVGLAWRRLPRLRPVATGSAVLLALAAVPGPGSGTALLIVLPALAVLAGVLARRAAGRDRPRALRIALAAGLGVAVLATGPAAGAAAAPDPDRHALSAWLRAELPPGATVSAPPLVAAQVVADGVPAGLVTPGPAPFAVGAPGPDALVVLPAGPAGGPVAVHGPAPATAPGGLGPALADNPAVQAAPAAAALLRADAVDARLVSALAGLSDAFAPTVAAFPAVDGEPPGHPRRRALVTEVDGRPATDPAVLAALTRWLDGQQPPYRPAAVEPGPDGVTVRYPLDPRRPA